MPAAVLHGPCQAGQQTSLAAERLEPVHVTVLVALFGLPYCLIWLATGLTGAAHAASCQQQDHKHNFAFGSCAGLRVRLKKEHVLRWGKPLDSQSSSPNHHRHPQPFNQMLSLVAQQPGSERTSPYGYSSTNLASRYPASNLQPSLGAHPATSYCL
jgi:hypothetical protein